MEKQQRQSSQQQESNQNHNLMQLTNFQNFVPDLSQAILDPNYTNVLINILQTSILLTTLNYNQQQNENTQKGSKTVNQTNISSNSDKSSGKNRQMIQQKKNTKSLSAYKNSKIKKQDSQVDQSYSPDNSKQKYPRRYKASETKNVTKNFGKAIIIFILKERELTSKILQKYGINQNQFIQYAFSLKYRTNSIKGLKALWLSQNNPYAKQLRILTFEFLRKHCLNYLFYSRVRNYSRGLKYRKKILQGLMCPEKFTFMKQY